MRYRNIFLALLIGCTAGSLGAVILSRTNNNAGDFGVALLLARDLLQGNDPYGHPVWPDWVAYPLPAGVLALPFAYLPDEVAGGLFLGISSALLAWCLLRTKEHWRLLLFLSWPFLYSLLFAQWPPLLVCIWFLPSLLPLILVKPQIVLPLALSGRLSRTGIVLSILLLAVSLILHPTWPWDWLEKIQTYAGTRPPLLALPLGPLMLLALLRWRDRRARLLLLMALMPQRVVYDQLPLLLVASTRRELLALVVCSWLSLPVLVVAQDWPAMPGGWRLWIILTLYLPALVILFRPDIERLLTDGKKRLRRPDAASTSDS